jgi:hypothetical protein
MRSSSERLARLRFEGGPAETGSGEGPDGLGRDSAGSGAGGAEEWAGLGSKKHEGACQLWDEGEEGWANHPSLCVSQCFVVKAPERSSL